MKGFIVYPTYKIVNDKAYIYLFGRLENGQSFLTISHFKPYFFIKTSDKKKAEKLAKSVDYSDSNFKDFKGNPVTKVTLEIPNDVRKLKNMFLEEGILCYEADIRFAMRFLIDNDLKGSVEIDGDYESSDGIDRVYKEPELKPCVYWPKLKILSLDIETDPYDYHLYSISLYTENFEKVLLLKEGKYKKAETFTDEGKLLERFKELVLELDPDIITGWNVIDFDFKLLKQRFDENEIPFQLGRINWPCKLTISDSFFKDSSADFPGRQVLDGLHLLKISGIKLDDYKLETASRKILGEGKLLHGEERYTIIKDYYEKDPQKLIDYNLKDSELAYNVIHVSGVLELALRRSMLTRMPLDRIKASIASFDSLYLKELQKRKIVAPSAHVSDRDERIIGGFVRDPKPGIYDNVAVFDFKSLYPSIIRTFNIDPLSFVPKEEAHAYKKVKMIIAPNGAHFKDQDGILPTMIQELWKERDAAKKRKDKLSSDAIKILMNSFFGVLANPTFRFYSLEMGNAITHFGQLIIKLAAEKLQDQGYDVIYGDTDSIFVDLKESKEKDIIKVCKEIEQYINSFLKAYVRKNYDRESFLELQFEKIFTKFLMPKVRGSEAGAKKRYAGMIMKDGKETLQIVGLEFVRRDWTQLAKKYQYELLERIFSGKEITKFTKSFVEKIKKGELDELLVYKKAIRKGVEEYTKTTPPHIKAARKAGIVKEGIIEYYHTINGPETVEHRKSKIDYDHYIEKQIKPIADSVLCFFNVKFDELLKGNKQVSLSDY